MSVLIKDMNIPDKCWDCELFDELSIHFTGITAPDTDMGWCRGCKKEILNIDYKEDKPFWCPLINSLSATDMVEVVRCKYCKYHGATIEEQPTPSIMCAHMHDNDYCSYGKRRD